MPVLSLVEGRRTNGTAAGASVRPRTPPGIDMESHTDVRVECREDLHQPIQGETSEIGVTDACKISGGKPGHPACLRRAESAVLQHRDDSSRQNRLGVLQIRVRIAEIPEDVPASHFEAKVPFVNHRILPSNSVT